MTRKTRPTARTKPAGWRILIPTLAAKAAAKVGHPALVKSGNWCIVWSTPHKPTAGLYGPLARLCSGASSAITLPVRIRLLSALLRDRLFADFIFNGGTDALFYENGFVFCLRTTQRCMPSPRFSAECRTQVQECCGQCATTIRLCYRCATVCLSNIRQNGQTTSRLTDRVDAVAGSRASHQRA